MTLDQRIAAELRVIEAEAEAKITMAYYDGSTRKYEGRVSDGQVIVRVCDRIRRLLSGL